MNDRPLESTPRHLLIEEIKRLREENDKLRAQNAHSVGRDYGFFVQGVEFRIIEENYKERWVELDFVPPVKPNRESMR